MTADELYDALATARAGDKVVIRTPDGGVWVPMRIHRSGDHMIIMCLAVDG